MGALSENHNLAVAIRACSGIATLLLACAENPSGVDVGHGGSKNGAHAGGSAGDKANAERGGASGASSGGATNTGNGGATIASSGGATNTGNGGATSTGSGGSNASSGGSTNSGRGGTAGGSLSSGGRTSGAGGTSGASAGGSLARGGASGSGGALAAGGAGGLAGATGASGAGATNSSILEPESGVLLGQYYGDASISATGSKLGRTLPIHLTYYAWDDEWTSGNTKSDLNAGRIPLVNWELFGAKLEDISGGAYDTMLAQRAKDAKNLGKKFFLDFGAEMNGEWSPWSGAQNGSSAAAYLAAYRHTHDALVAGGATNVVWVWCPNVTDEPNQSWNRALEYYPGDAYVDWTCVDGYNWGTSDGGRWQSFRDVFKDIYAKLLTKNKPIMIGEMASAEVGGDKAAWISAMIPSLKTDFPRIKALVWFDVNKETDWRISSSPESQAAFVQMVKDPYTNP